MRRLLLAIVSLLIAGPVAAQTTPNPCQQTVGVVTNPTRISAELGDHLKTLPGGGFLVSGYRADIYLQGGSAPFTNIQIARGDWTLVAGTSPPCYQTQKPLPYQSDNTPQVLKLIALSTAAGNSPPSGDSNPFYKPGPPQAPGVPRITP